MLLGSRSTVKTRLCPSCLPEFHFHSDPLSSLYLQCIAIIHWTLRQGPRQVFKYPTRRARSPTFVFSHFSTKQRGRRHCTISQAIPFDISFLSSFLPGLLAHKSLQRGRGPCLPKHATSADCVRMTFTAGHLVAIPLSNSDGPPLLRLEPRPPVLEETATALLVETVPKFPRILAAEVVVVVPLLQHHLSTPSGLERMLESKGFLLPHTTMKMTTTTTTTTMTKTHMPSWQGFWQSSVRSLCLPAHLPAST
jgi:hypothetical protein